MDFVLDAVHKVEAEKPNEIPNRDRIVEGIVFKRSDVVMLQAKDVDLEYAQKGENVFYSVRKLFYMLTTVILYQIWFFAVVWIFCYKAQILIFFVRYD